MQKGNASTFDSPQVRFLLRMPLPSGFTHYLGRKLFRFLLTLQGLGAFGLITIGVILTKPRTARHVIWPLVFHETSRAGLRLLPMFLFVALALGLLVIGQSVSWLTRVGAINYLGTIMVIVVVRELGPLLAALLILARIGTANVVELGTSRATGEVEALEALGIDPIHYLVVPRVVGLALSVFSLTVYLILGALIQWLPVGFPAKRSVTAVRLFSTADRRAQRIGLCPAGDQVPVVRLYHFDRDLLPRVWLNPCALKKSPMPPCGR